MRKLTEEEKKLIKYAKALSREEYFTKGHRGCQGCAPALTMRLITKFLGPDIIISMPTGCMEIISSYHPDNAWKVPWLHVAFEVAASVGSGMEAGLKALMRKGKLPKKEIKVVAIGGDGGTADIGLQALSGAFERGHDMIYICYDNEAYMNTGIQRSGLTPFHAWTTTSPVGKNLSGQPTWKKNMPEIMAAHRAPYVATACPSYPQDFEEKLQKAKRTKGPSYIHVLAPCPLGWRYDSALSIKLGRLAVETCFFPLYEVENGVYKITYMPEEIKHIKEYLSLQGRFRHLREEEIEEIEKMVKREFEILKKKCEWTSSLSHLQT